MINPKLNKDLDSYIAKRKDPKQSMPGFKLTIDINKHEKVPNLSPRKVHVLYRKPSLWQKLFSAKKEKREDPYESDYVEVDPATGMRKKLEKDAEEMKEIEREEEVLEKKRDGVFQRMLKSMKIIEEEQKINEGKDITIVEEETLPEDAVEMIRLMGKWLNKLDPEDKKEFKEGGDYAKYRSFLEKYGVVKKK